ncbi:hypothetical protein NV377_03465 [Paenibacillus sp. T3-5-0-4]|nr:hypothetical protein [Paenibacillus endoradicis]
MAPSMPNMPPASHRYQIPFFELHLNEGCLILYDRKLLIMLS